VYYLPITSSGDIPFHYPAEGYCKPRSCDPTLSVLLGYPSGCGNPDSQLQPETESGRVRRRVNLLVVWMVKTTGDREGNIGETATACRPISFACKFFRETISCPVTVERMAIVTNTGRESGTNSKLTWREWC